MNSGSSLVDPLDATSGTLWDPQLKNTTLCKFTRHLFQKLQLVFNNQCIRAFNKRMHAADQLADYIFSNRAASETGDLIKQITKFVTVNNPVTAVCHSQGCSSKMKWGDAWNRVALGKVAHCFKTNT